MAFDPFGQSNRPKPKPIEISQSNYSGKEFNSSDSLLYKEVLGVCESDKNLDADRYCNMAVLFENSYIQSSGSYRETDVYYLKDTYKEYSLEEWNKFMNFACVQNFISNRQKQRFGEMIDALYDEIKRQQDSKEGINSQLINSLNKAIEGLQKLMAIGGKGETFVTVFLPKKDYNSIISNKVVKTDCMEIVTDNTNIKDFGEEVDAD